MHPRTLPLASTLPVDRALDDAASRRPAPIASPLSITRVMADIDLDMALRRLEREVAAVAHANVTASRRHP